MIFLYFDIPKILKYFNDDSSIFLIIANISKIGSTKIL